MTRGILMFAFDNGTVPYTRFAAWSAGRIQRHLGLPVSVITNADLSGYDTFDQVIQIPATANGSREGTWFNLGRWQAHALSPYDQTVLLDADYVVCSDQLLTLFDSNQDMLSMRFAYDVTNRRDYQDLNFFGRHRMPSAWATVVYWRTSHVADLVFGMIRMIEQNWQHYKNIYGIAERRFRNDYALAIANNTVMGHIGSWPEIPWNMATVESGCDITCLSADRFEVAFQDQHNRRRRIRIQDQDLHVMDKNQLVKTIDTHS